MVTRGKAMDKKEAAIVKLKEKLLVAEAQRLNGEKTISRDEMIEKIELKISRAKRVEI